MTNVARLFFLIIFWSLPMHKVLADNVLSISWEDLIPPNVPYSERIDLDKIDHSAKISWKPIYDENATKLNELLNGKKIQLDGFVVPLEFDPDGVSDFILVPYYGACIHVPPPPPNQLVLVSSKILWKESRWIPVTVSGKLTTKIQETDRGDTGYALDLETIEMLKIYQ